MIFGMMSSCKVAYLACMLKTWWDVPKTCVCYFVCWDCVNSDDMHVGAKCFLTQESMSYLA